MTAICNTHDVLSLAAQLNCSARQVRPCLASAYLTPKETSAQRAHLAHDTLAFVASELFSIVPTTKAAATALRDWGKSKGIDRDKTAKLLCWMSSNPWRPKGCSKRSVARKFCCGKENCSYHAQRRWQSGSRAKEVDQCDLRTFRMRAWDTVIPLAEQAIYRALCSFEEEHRLKPGTPLLFGTRQARALTRMGEPRQRRALEGLQVWGLVKVVHWGASRTAGKKVQTRTVRRVVPIPYCR